MPYKTVNDIKEKIDADPFLGQEDSANIVLFHDHNGTHDDVKSLIAHTVSSGIRYLSVA